MRNTALWIALIVFALIIGILFGYILGSSHVVEGARVSVSETYTEVAQLSDAVGAYKTDAWNGDSASLVLKSDGTCLYPTGNAGTWTQDGKDILITMNHDGDTHPAELVDAGIILYGHFFERVD